MDLGDGKVLLLAMRLKTILRKAQGPEEILELQRKEKLTSSNTSFSLYCVKALHSTYLTAPKSLAIRSPSSFRTGCMRCLASLSFTLGSSRRSVWVPTIRQGTPGQWWCTSGNHFSRTFSNEAGEVTLKQTRKTSVWGYESGRKRS